MPTPRFLPASVCLLVLLCLPVPTLAAQAVTIYRCTDAEGNLTVQNQPCPEGTVQRQQQVRDVASTPGAAATHAPPPALPPQAGTIPAMPAAPLQAVERSADGGFITTSTGPEPRILDSAHLPQTPPPPLPSAAEADAVRLPPPPLFRCTTYDGDSYLSEEQEVAPRCLPLRTVGLDGNPNAGAGMACEVVRDQCARVPDGAACEAWQKFTREAESRWRFAHPDNVERRRVEYERLAKIVAESCGS